MLQIPKLPQPIFQGSAGFTLNRLVSMACYGIILQIVTQQSTNSSVYILAVVSVASALVFLILLGVLAAQGSPFFEGKRVISTSLILTLLGITLLSILGIMQQSFANMYWLYGITFMVLSIGSAGLFFCWCQILAKRKPFTIFIIFCTGFFFALVLLIPLSFFHPIIRGVVLIIACIGDIYFLVKSNEHPAENVANAVIQPEQNKKITIKLYAGMTCYGIAMGISSTLLPHTGQGVYLNASIMRVVCALIIFGVTFIVIKKSNLNFMHIGYKMAYLIIVLNTVILLFIPQMPTILLAVLFVSHLLIMATLITIVISGSQVLKEIQGIPIAIGVALFLSGDLIARASHDLLIMMDIASPTIITTISSIILLMIIVFTYAFIFTEKDLDIIHNQMYPVPQTSTYSQKPEAHNTNNRKDPKALAEDLGNTYALTPREKEILGLVLIGRSSPRIQSELFISESTVHTHMRHIYGKMGVKSKQELIDLSEAYEIQ